MTVQRNNLDAEYENVVFTSGHIHASHDVLAGLLTIAWDGGSNYWINQVKIDTLMDYSVYEDHKWCKAEIAYHTLMSGGTIEITDREGGVYELNLSKWMEGLRLWIARQGKWESKKHHIDETGKINLCMFHSNDAGCVLQYALFNTIYYGTGEGSFSDNTMVALTG